jgi:hypothetical protein
MSKINKEAWEKIKEQMEYYLEQDHNLTDVIINYQVKIPEAGTRNYLRLSITVDNN